MYRMPAFLHPAPFVLLPQLQLPDGPGLTCSGGAVLCADPDTAADILIEQADQALYQAKRRNKGTCLLWDKQA